MNKRILAFCLFLQFCGVATLLAQNRPVTKTMKPSQPMPTRPTLTVQLGHSEDIPNVTYSQDGRFVLTGGNDNTARLWDTKTGKELCKFEVPFSDVLHSQIGSHICVAISNDNRFVLTGSVDKTVRMWETATGKEIKQFSGHSDMVMSVAFSPNRREILTSDNKEVTRLWDSVTGKLKRKFAGMFAAFSFDGQQILTWDEDRFAYLYEVQTGKMLRKFTGRLIAFSPRSNLVLIGEENKNVELFNIRTGKKLREFPNGLSQRLTAISPDGRVIACILHRMNKNVILLIDARKGALMKRMILPEGLVDSIAFPPDGRFILTSGEDRVAHQWDIVTGEEALQFAGQPLQIQSLDISPDARFVVTSGNAKNVCVWNMMTGKQAILLAGHTDIVESVAFSPDSQFVITGSRDKTARLWDITTGREIRRFEGHPEAVNSVAFSPDNSFILTGDSQKARLWDVTTGEEVQKFGEYSLTVAFAPDGKYALTGSGEFSASLWNVTTGNESQKFEGGEMAGVIAGAVSPNGQLVLTVNGEDIARLWNAKTGKAIQQFPSRNNSYEDCVSSIAFSSDSRYILTGGYDKTARLWNVATGKEVQRFTGHSDRVHSVKFSPNGRFVFTGSSDGTTRLWETATGKELCRLISFNDGNWVVVDPEGRFDTGNLEEINGLSWIMPDDPMKPLPVEIFMRQYYEPRLLARIMAGEKFAPVPSLASLNRVQPKVKILSVKPEEGKTDAVSVTVQVGKAKGNYIRNGKTVTLETGVYDLRLFRDGQLVGYSPNKNGEAVPLDPNGTATLTFRNVKLPQIEGSKTVEFSAYAFNVDRVKSETHRTTYTLPQSLTAAKGRAYLLTVGVNAYEDSRWNLRFAANDAKRMQDILGAQLRPSGQYTEVVNLSLLSDHNAGNVTENRATRQNFKLVLDVLSGRTQNAALLAAIPNADKLRQVHPEDLIIISWSGHGYADGSGNFYLLPYDIGANAPSMTPEVLRKTVSSDELSLWLRDVDAGAMAMIIDACHSAASVENNEFKPGPMGSRGLGQLAYDKGMLILAASQADNVALESQLLQQGLLSYALVQNGLDAAQADWQPKNGQITLGEWLAYGVERVPSLYEEMKRGAVQSFGKGVAIASGEVKQVSRFQQPSLFNFNKRNRDALLTRQ